MGIVDEDIVRVREAIDLVQVVSGYTQLKRVGQRWTGLCPFHSEKTPSFSVNGVDGVYHCFGCKASGDAITFVREVEHLDFPGAVEWLAAKANITLRYTERDESESRRRQARLLELVERAAEWYHQRLRTAPDAAAARSYLRSRGFDADEVARYRVGWAPDGWDELVRSLRVPKDDVVAAGLGFENRAGRMQDFFRARVLFPISDERGRVIGFGGRKLPDADGAKYQNSRDSALYNKSRALYGLDRGKARIVTAGRAIVCEGYTDVIGFDRAGIDGAVATCGTSLTDDHVKLLAKFTRRLVLAYDADEAGQSAAERVYAWERTHELEVAVVDLPPGADPDELARDDPERLRAAVEHARPFLRFRLDRVLAAADLERAEGRARAADAGLAVIAEHPDDLVRDQYLMDLADACRMDAQLLRPRLAEVRRRPRPAPEERSTRRRERGAETGDGGGPPSDETAPWGDPDEPLPEDPGGGDRRASGVPVLGPLPVGVEREALRLAVQHPELVAPFLEEHLFDHPTAQAAFRALSAAHTLAEAMVGAPPAVAELIADLSVDPTETDANDVLARFASEAGRRTLTELEAEARTAEDPLAYADVVAWLKVTLDHLRRPHAEVETVTRLLAFLSDGRGPAAGEE
jgi:DNA primase